MKIIDELLGVFFDNTNGAFEKLNPTKSQILEHIYKSHPWLRDKTISEGVTAEDFGDNEYYISIPFKDKDVPTSNKEKIISLSSKISNLREELSSLEGELTSLVNKVISGEENYVPEKCCNKEQQFRQKLNHTGKTYKELAIEIMNSNPDKWWTTGEITDDAIIREYFDIKNVARYQIQGTFYGILTTDKEFISEKRSLIENGTKKIWYFKLKNLEEETDDKEGDTGEV